MKRGEFLTVASRRCRRKGKTSLLLAPLYEKTQLVFSLRRESPEQLNTSGLRWRCVLFH
jgi:hypothetical protein